MYKLQGKVAVVTGASKGIGASIAEPLAAEGASVVVNGASSKGGAESAVKRIHEKGGNALPVQADVSKPDDIKRSPRPRLLTENWMCWLTTPAFNEFASLESITAEHFHKHFNPQCARPASYYASGR